MLQYFAYIRKGLTNAYYEKGKEAKAPAHH